MLRFIASLTLIISLSAQAWADKVIRVESAQSLDNAAYYYYLDLLRLILDSTATDYDAADIIVVTETVLSQSRSFSMLKNNMLDVFWAGSNTERDRNFTAVSIPLIGELLGLRVPVIMTERVGEFESITQPEQLQQLVACQGAQWPDSDILEYNGYHVERVNKFQLIYSMLKQKRCDYFPRGLSEVYAEVNSQGNEGVVVYDKLILRYPLQMNFFVNKNNEQLAKRLTVGLQRLERSGALQKFIMQHPTTRNVFPLSRYHNSLVLDLTNPFLPAKNTTQNSSLLGNFP